MKTLFLGVPQTLLLTALRLMSPPASAPGMPGKIPEQMRHDKQNLVTSWHKAEPG